MQQREKKLAIALAALLIVLSVAWIYTGVSAAFERRNERITILQNDIGKKKTAIRRGKRAAAQRTAWREQSLPSNRELALSKYQNWLRNVIDSAGLEDANVNSQVTRSRSGQFQRLSFTITGQAGLDQLARMLYQFYRADHLHQIRRLAIRPIEGSSQLDVSLGIEALVLPGAARTDELNPGASDRLAFKSVEEYVKPLVERNLFAAYVPPKPKPKPRPPIAKRPTPRPKPKPTFDLAKHAVVTGIINGRDGQPQVWVKVRTTGETLKLGVGDKFEVGALQAIVAEIRPLQVVLSSDGKKVFVPLGASLRDATPLADDG